MNVNHYDEVESRVVDMPGALGCKVRWLIGEKQGAPTFAMRHFEVSPGGHTPRHSHAYEHEVFVLEGRGVARGGDQTFELKAGDVILVKPNEVHQFCNNSDQPLKFLCLVPNSWSSHKVTVAPECGVESVEK